MILFAAQFYYAHELFVSADIMQVLDNGACDKNIVTCISEENQVFVEMQRAHPGILVSPTHPLRM